MMEGVLKMAMAGLTLLQYFGSSEEYNKKRGILTGIQAGTFSAAATVHYYLVILGSRAHLPVQTLCPSAIIYADRALLAYEYTIHAKHASKVAIHKLYDVAINDRAT